MAVQSAGTGSRATGERHEAESAATLQARTRGPTWLRQVAHYLPICPQLVLSENVRDVHLVPGVHGTVLTGTIEALWQVLREFGTRTMVVIDPIDGVRAEVAPGTERERVRIGERELPGRDPVPAAPQVFGEWMHAVSAEREEKCALVIDYASRITRSPEALEPNEHRLFAAAEKLAHTAAPLRGGEALPYNPILWIAERAGDLPAWLTAGSERVHPITVSLPSRTVRGEAAATLVRGLAGDEPDIHAGRFADLTDGLTLRAMTQICVIARRERLPLARIGDAVRAYKVGVTDNPWRQPYLRQAVAEAYEAISRDVIGQGPAVRRLVHMLKRSVTGLSGAQAGVHGRRPRGVAFLAGPTGTGKTEAARSIARLLFGGEEALIRFDMSEFATEQAGERLTGAPPGYIGYDTGGELVNAVRERPFSVVLFDEIEKAHGRILDRLLQILDAGRLTDSRGSTVHFTECLIMLTSNLGVQGMGPGGERIANVTPDDPRETVEARVTSAVEHTLRFELGRPELLNRIGENIIVFDFIREDAAEAIFGKMVGQILERVASEHGVRLTLAEAAHDVLRERCLADLGHGGRGIGNQLEATLVNPLAEALFDGVTEGVEAAAITWIGTEDGVCRVGLETVDEEPSREAAE